MIGLLKIETMRGASVALLVQPGDAWPMVSLGMTTPDELANLLTMQMGSARPAQRHALELTRSAVRAQQVRALNIVRLV